MTVGSGGAAMLRSRAAAFLGAAGVLLLPLAVAAQQIDPMRRAFDLERRGSYADAAETYRAVLRRNPAESAALFGLERALLALNRSAEILPQVNAAIVASPKTVAFYGVAVRAWAAANQPDSVRRVVERWVALDPGDESPYREWGTAAIARRDRAEARRAYLAGRERLRRPDVLAPELAEVAVEEQDWPTALHEWLTAIGQTPAYHSTAVMTLGGVPESVRPDLLRQLQRESDGPARSLEANLRARWGDPAGGFESLSRTLPADTTQAIDMLRIFLEQIRGQSGAKAKRAQALTLEAIADRSPGADGARLRLEAAQAFADGGDQRAARRMLSGVAADSSSPAGLASRAAMTLIGVMLSEGKLDEAERKLAEMRGSLTSEDARALSRRMAWSWARSGKLARADSLIARDTSVEGLAVAGRIRLLQGDVRGALARLQGAGPFAGTREEATERTALLALLQPIEADSVPALGRSLLQLEAGDTVAAVASLEKVASELPPDRGGAELRLYAGNVARAAGKQTEAERLFRAADVAEARATAPAAELALGRLLLDLDRAREAVGVLEHLILTFPDSALIPQARRALDEARGAVPRT